MIEIDWKFRHQRHREVIGGLQDFYGRLDTIKDPKMVITELQTQVGNLCDYCQELEELVNDLITSKESHESTVDEIKRYRSEYAEQGNEEAKP